MKRKKILITGGAGFVGSHLVRYLFKENQSELIIFDKLEYHKPENYTKNVTYVKGNIISREQVTEVFKKYGPFDGVYHLAAAMPNKAVSNDTLWQINVSGTINIIEEAVRHNTNYFVFTSSNVTYGIPKALPVVEDTETNPLEIYGKSKIQAENELKQYKDQINIQVIRCPVVTGVGRLGLQAILYEFISENKNVYVLGDGSNKYQFIDVMDVCVALEKASYIKGFDIYNIGADQVLTLRELYKGVIDYAQSTSKIISTPKAPALFILSILDKFNISPLGVYQYTMIGRSIYADTTKIKKRLDWIPKKTNLDTFVENYKWYIENKGKFVNIRSGKASSNRSLPKMGILKLLKILS